MSTKAVRQAIVSTLAGITAGESPAGSTHVYVYTFSGAKQVRSGKYEAPPMGHPASHPFACVWTITVAEEPATLSAFGQQGEFGVIAWAPASPQLASARQDASEDLLDDLRAALRANPKLGGAVVKFSAAATTFQDESDQTSKRTPWGICSIGVSAIWRER